MVSLWGSKKDDDPEDTSARPQNGEQSHAAEPRHSEANERTRLLQPPPQSQGYLSPDDPAVSPYLQFPSLFTEQLNIYSACNVVVLHAYVDRYPRTTFGVYDSYVTSPYYSPL